MESWRKNLFAVAIAEFVVIMGFSFVNPFMPLFVQELGSFTSRQAALWAGISTGSMGLATFLSAPGWGILADRWGRKPMVLRSQFGSALVLALAGLSPNIYFFTGLRFMQGLLSGTVAAASALVSSTAPRDRIPFAMGLLMASVYGGSTIGPLVGGILADAVGYRITFYITGAIIFLGALVVLIFARETFERPAGRHETLGSMWHLAVSGRMLPLLMVVCAVGIGPQMIAPLIPLLFADLNYSGSVATVSGLAFALLGVIGAISAFTSGHLGKRIPLRTILVFSCAGTGLLYLPPIWAQTPAQLIPLVGFTGLLVGGLWTSSSALVGLSTAHSQQGVAYGLSASATSLGIGLGPLIGGSLASILGLRPAFGVAGGLFILIGILASRLLVRRPLETGFIPGDKTS
jgi:DHA1 family multidrug resistance protein-like MFS transporter